QGAAGPGGAGIRAQRRRAPASLQGQRRNAPEEHRSAQARARQPEPLVSSPGFAGLELLPTAVVALDEHFVVRYANPAAESLLATGAKSLNGHPFLQLFSERADLERALADALGTHWDYSAQYVTYTRPGREPLPLACTMTR